MSLLHAILGMLQWQPMTGYDLKTLCFDGSLQHFWPADQAQIYRTLDKLAEQGMVTSTIETQEERPNRKVYSLTAAGREELTRWLAESDHMLTYRDPFLIHIFFAGQLSNAEIADHLRTHRSKHQALLDEYRTIPLPELDALLEAGERDLVFQRLTLEFGLRFQRMYTEWLDQAMETVSRLSDPSA